MHEQPLILISKSSEKLKITEIFYSLQGEADTVGMPTVFVRLTGCPLRCGYCDTEYAFNGGEWFTIEDVLQRVGEFRTMYVTVTGGEPLAQKSCLSLLRSLCDHGYRVSLETSGAIDIAQVDSRVVKVVDIKTPGSGEHSKNRLENIQYLEKSDQLKFVICHRADYDWCRAFLEEWQLAGKCQLLFSPSYHQLDARTLAEWILADQLPVRFQIQLHKYLWGEMSGR